MSEKASTRAATVLGTAWSRREVLVTMTAMSVMPAVPAWAAPNDGLRAICRDAVRRETARHVGVVLAGGRSAAEIESALRARSPESGRREDWLTALLELARQDLARDDTVIVQGMCLSRAEAEVLALGACLDAAPRLI